MTTKIQINKSTTVKINITNPNVDHPITGYAWKLNGNVLINNTDTLNLPASSVVGDQYSVECTVTNDCGSTVFSETLILIDPSIIIQNGSFATDLSNWVFDQSNAIGTVVALNHEAVVNMTVVPPGSMNQLYQTGISLLPNTDYRLKFDADVTLVGTPNYTDRDIEVYLHDEIPHTWPEGQYIVNPYIDTKLSPTKTTYTKLTPEIPFKTGSVVPASIRLRIKFVNVGIYYLDNIIIEPTTACPTPACGITVYQL